MNKFLLKYFYSWYTLPLVILHDLTHYIMSILAGVMVTKVRFFKTKHHIYNIGLTFEHSELFKIKLIAYAPLILLLPFILMFFYPTFLFISIYLFTTIFRVNGTFHWLVLPSKNDRHLYREWYYNQYLIENIGFENFNDVKIRNEMRVKKHLFSKPEFFLYKKWK